MLKEKLKLLKTDIKVCHMDTFGIVETTISQKKQEIEQLDRVDDTFGLEKGEIIQRNQCFLEIIRALIWKEKLMYQRPKHNGS